MRATTTRLLACGIAALLVPVTAGTAAAARTPAKVDLAVTISDAPDPVQAGQRLTYTITVSNAGPASASSVTVTDDLPSSVAPLTATAPEGCTVSGQRVVCQLGTVAKGGSAGAVIEVRPQHSGTVQNTAVATSAQREMHDGDNAATAVTTVQDASPTPAPDLPVGSCTVLDAVAPEGQLWNECRFVSTGAELLTAAVSSPVVPVDFSAYHPYASWGAELKTASADSGVLAECSGSWPEYSGGGNVYYDVYLYYAVGQPGTCTGAAEVDDGVARPLPCPADGCATQPAPRPGDVLVCRARAAVSYFSYYGYDYRNASTSFRCSG